MVSKVENDCPEVSKQAEAKRDGVINPQITISINFNTENFDALKRYESTKVDRRTWLHVPSNIEEQDKSSDIEQQPPSGDRM